MALDFNFLPYYKYFLEHVVSQNISGSDYHIPVKSLQSLGKALNIESMRVIIVNDIKLYTKFIDIIGNKNIWNNISIDEIKSLTKEKIRKTKHQYFEINHIQGNGHVIVFGYLACYSRQILSKNIIEGIKLYCSFWGDYLSRILLSTHYKLASRYISSLISVSGKDQQPGATIVKIMRYLGVPPTFAPKVTIRNKIC